MKKSTNNKSIRAFQNFQIQQEQLQKIKGGSDSVIIEEVMDV